MSSSNTNNNNTNKNSNETTNTTSSSNQTKANGVVNGSNLGDLLNENLIHEPIAAVEVIITQKTNVVHFLKPCVVI